MMVLGQYRVVLVGSLWYRVSMGQDCFVLGGTKSVLSGTGRYVMILGQ